MYITVANSKGEVILLCTLIKTTRRITFDIDYQDSRVTNAGTDENYLRFKASNGVEIFSRSRMDIQTDRIWLKGCEGDERSIRSGTMTFSSDESRDAAFDGFVLALHEWGTSGWDEK